MTRTASLGVMVTSLMVLMLSSTGASAAGFLQKTVTCPKNNVTLVPADNLLEIEDIVVSANKNQTVTFKFKGVTTIPMLVLYIKANDTVVTNFQGQVEGEDEFSFKLDCSGTDNTKVSVTIVGTSSLN